MKGTVAVYYDCARPGVGIPAPSFQFLMETMKLSACLPVRNSAMHFCMKTGMGNTSMNDAILEFILERFQSYDRVRASLHLGSDMEIQYHLRSRGIPIDTLPVDKEGNFHEDVLNAWFYKHRDEGIMNMPLSNEYEDRNDDNEEIVDDANGQASARAVDNDNASASIQPSIQPTDQDVLFGKGKRIQYHPGNVQFRAFVVYYSEMYDNARRKQKVALLTHVVLVLRARGVRFFQQSEPGGVWIESDVKDAEKKVGQV